MKNLFIIALSQANFAVFGQSLQEKLAKIKTQEQANDFVYENAENGADFIKIYSEDTKNDFEKKLLSASNGELLSDDIYYYKHVTTEKNPSFRVSYIFLNSKRMPLEKIKALRGEIIKAYKSGTPFQELATKYTMDSNPNADLGWFAAGEMVPEFEEAIKAHKKGDIFTSDSPEKNWYHVVLKTHDDTIITSKGFVKIKKQV